MSSLAARQRYLRWPLEPKYQIQPTQQRRLWQTQALTRCQMTTVIFNI